MFNQSFPIERKYTFTNFIEGENNKRAKRAAMQIADRATNFNLLYIWSSSGLGKTHLLHAIANYLMDKRMVVSTRIVYIPASEFMREFQMASKENLLFEFRRKYREMCDVFLLDDLNLLESPGRTATREELFETINYLLITKKIIVITADKPPTELKNFEQKLVTRLQWGPSVQILPPNFETRIAILKAKAAERGYMIPNEVIVYIAERITGNVRWLEGALETVIMHAEIEERDPDIELAERALSQLSFPIKNNVDADKIIEQTAKFFKISPQEIKSQRRKKTISTARQIAMYLCREILSLSTTQIGAIFGNRDHSTVIYAIEKIKSEKEKDFSLQTALNTIREMIMEEGERVMQQSNHHHQSSHSSSF